MSMTSSKNAKISHPSSISNFSSSEKISSGKSTKNGEMELGKYLGMDFGKAKIGLAVADSETRIAFGYGVLKNDKDLLKNLAEIVKKNNISKIIIGMAGIETRHGVSLLKKLNIPIEFQNEMFSTLEAERNLIEKGAKKIKRFDDQEAARIILQSWLDKKR